MELIRGVNEAVARGDPASVAEVLHPDVVWEHNIGAGSPEEGVYRGREEVIRLFERLVEAWEYISPQARDIQVMGDGSYHVTGDLHAKHATTEREIVSHFEQQLEIRDATLVRGRMNTGEMALS